MRGHLIQAHIVSTHCPASLKEHHQECFDDYGTMPMHEWTKVYCSEISLQWPLLGLPVEHVASVALLCARA